MNQVIKYLSVVVLALFLGFTMVSVGITVHKGAGNMVCDGCHTMHNSQNNISEGGSPTDYLLKAAGTEALCLSCHEAGGDASAPQIKTATGTPAAGDFDMNDAVNDAGATDNEGRGHNIGLTAAQTVIPAGSAGGEAITQFNCSHCHDPHGVASTTADVAAYRNLRLDVTDMGAGTVPGGTPADIRAWPLEGSLVGDVYTTTNNAYGTAGTGVSNISQWCGMCHDNFFGTVNQGSPSPWQRHPTDVSMGATIYGNYDDVAAASRYPAEDTASSATANSTSSPRHAGNEANDGVFCLSCHNAHSSAANTYEDTLRWDYDGVGQGGSTSASACGRCHNK